MTVALPPPVHSAIIGAGNFRAGEVVSFTVTVKLHESDPQELTAVAVTVVVPTGNVCGEVIVVVPIL